MDSNARDMNPLEDIRGGESPAHARRRTAALGIAVAVCFSVAGCAVDPVAPETAQTSPQATAGRSHSESATAAGEPSLESGDRCEAVLHLKKEGIRKVGERTETQTVERPPQRFTRVLWVERDFRPSYLLGSPACHGRCSKNPGGKCEQELTFAWTIVAAAGTRAAITAGANSEKVTVRWTGNGTVTLMLSVTLQCTCDGKPSGKPVTRTATFTSNVNVFA